MQPEQQQTPYQQPYQQQPYQQQPYQQQPYQQQPYQQPATPPPYLTAAASAQAQQATASRGKRDIIFGAVWLVLGLAVTGWSMVYFEGAGFIVAWGPALYGIYKIIKGAVTVSRAS